MASASSVLILLPFPWLTGPWAPAASLPAPALNRQGPAVPRVLWPQPSCSGGRCPWSTTLQASSPTIPACYRPRRAVRPKVDRRQLDRPAAHPRPVAHVRWSTASGHPIAWSPAGLSIAGALQTPDPACGPHLTPKPWVVRRCPHRSRSLITPPAVAEPRPPRTPPLLPT